MRGTITAVLPDRSACLVQAQGRVINTSGDIVRVYGETLDRLGVEWRAVRRPTGAYNVSVARRASVALMDAHIGPKR
ncbi:hypothetical protein [Streptomyces sp. SS8]